MIAISADGSVVLEMEDSPSDDGWWVRDGGLRGWYDSPDVRSEVVARSAGVDGGYAPYSIDLASRVVEIEGFHWADSEADAVVARRLVSSLAKKTLTVTVTDAEGALSAEGIVQGSIKVTPFTRTSSEFSVVVACDDPRLYGAVVTQSGTSSSAAGSGGLMFPIFDVTGFAEFTETAGSYRKFLVNDGTVESFPTLTVAGPFEWFRFTLNGSTVEFVRNVPAGQSVRLEFASESVWIGGSDVTGFLTRDEFFSVPVGGAWLQFFADTSGVAFTVESRGAWL